MLTTAPTAFEIEVTSLPQLCPVGSWQIELSHDRTQDLVIWITRGQGRVMLDGQRRGFGPHSMFYIPAGSLWSLELGRQCIGSCLFLPPRSMLPQDRPALSLRVDNTQDQAQMTFILERLQREQRDQFDKWREAMAALARILVIELERAAQSQPQVGRISASQRLSRAYCDRVARMYCEGASMSEHAHALEVTPTHLTRVIKSETGKTAATLLTERQLHSARSKLIYSDMPVQDIATKLGFGSPAYFTRFITQHTGQTPSRLRRSTRSVA